MTFGENAVLRVVRGAVESVDGYGDPVDDEVTGPVVWRGSGACVLRRSKAATRSAGDGDAVLVDEVIVRTSQLPGVDVDAGASWVGATLEVDDARRPGVTVRNVYRVRAAQLRAAGTLIDSWRFTVDAVGVATV